MATRLSLWWQPNFEGASRRDRQGCRYEAYLPDPLRGWDPLLPADLAADVADAEDAVRRLNARGTAHVSLEGLARFLLRAESVASSRIEGLAAAPRRLLRAEAVIAEGGDARDRVAVEVLGNIAAMESAVDMASAAPRFGLEQLLAVHRLLMARSPTPHVGGVLREEQNWLGGSAFNPCGAAFVPPPPERVPQLLDDCLAYVNGDAHSPLVQAALAHAQFETIHPFADGNGRTGRALIHVVLRRRGLAPRFVPPVSLVLATWADAYVAGLTTFRHLAGPSSRERAEAAAGWLRVFTTAVHRSCVDAQRYADRTDALAEQWRDRVGKVRAGSSTDLLLRTLPGAPVITVSSASALIGRSRARVNDAINALLAVGILTQRNVGKQRYRVFEAADVLELLTSLERALASPTGDTTTAVPIRPVPARPSSDG